ncbi:PLP-dependent aminotransferase family protein [Pseudodesulfovibrio tunisiensis]|uniref:aminotransferase-like domain-containing protein n=1 Tax=Pseudodesulfovibrio tunisiensis TaxID=463192 RepID=UPI001FB33608|nr:PLP-dependent aminotransferase family protein [Pseudodesulfovibrio tunisiensis]
MARYGLDASPDEVVVCSGAQHALTCCLTGLFRPGDRIAADAQTYPGMKTLAAMLGVRLVPVAMDRRGMIPEKLDATCAKDSIKGLYLMPGVHNPTTATMDAERREAIAAVGRKHSLILIEDDAYDLTVQNALPPVSSMMRESSVYIAGLSKSLAAGLRVAFMASPRPLRRRLAQSVLNTVWMTPPLSAELACQWIKDGTADHTVEIKRAEARRRFLAAVEYLDDLVFYGQPTSFFIWLRLPEPWRGHTFEAQARKAGVNVFGAEKFTIGDSHVPAAARLSLSGPADIDELRQGLAVIRDLLHRPELAEEIP